MFTETTLQRTLIVLFRLSMGWVFLWAAIRQIPDAGWSAAGFLSGAKTFPAFFDLMATPPFITVINALIPWAHLLIGLALILGIGMRLAAIAGAALMILYYVPRLDFPFVGEGVTNLIVEYHLVYTFVIVYLAAVRAGRVFGLEGWLERLPAARAYLQQHPTVRVAIS
jgi:thiosulfate dehydrogenase (quinone) large subunit